MSVAATGGDRRTTVAILGTTQTIAWASSYYLPAILAEPMAANLGLDQAWIFGAFSGALLVAAAVGPLAGRMVDAQGGRGTLALSNILFAAGLAALAVARSATGLVIAWLFIGVGMAMGLYDIAFATLARNFGAHARGPITGVTLIAGFASTIGWPLTALFEAEVGWRGACVAWAGLHLLIALPLNRLLVPPAPAAQPIVVKVAKADAPPRLAFFMLAYVFAVVWFVSTAMAAHLPRLLQASGLPLAGALAASALVGPAQVFARLVEFGLLRRVHPLVSARLAAVLHPAGAALFGLLGFPAAVLAVMHGAGNGLLTIAAGTLPLAMFGPTGYGLRQGLLAAPARIVQATAPFVFAIWLADIGVGALAITTGLLLSAAIILLILRAEPYGLPAAAPPDR